MHTFHEHGYPTNFTERTHTITKTTLFPKLSVNSGLLIDERLISGPFQYLVVSAFHKVFGVRKGYLKQFWVDFR